MNSVDGHLKVDIRDLHRRGTLTPGRSGFLRWRPGTAEASYRAAEDGFELAGQWLPITRTASGFGGSRIWWNCPLCSKRRAVLYYARQRWGCRECHGLLYGSQEESPHERLLTRAQDLHRQLGGDGDFTKAAQFLPKPSGMQVRTWRRLQREFEQAYAKWNRAAGAALAQLRRLERDEDW